MIIAYLALLAISIVAGLYDARYTNAGLRQGKGYEGEDWLADHYGAANVPYWALIAFNLFQSGAIAAFGAIGFIYQGNNHYVFTVIAMAGFVPYTIGALLSARKWAKLGARP